MVHAQTFERGDNWLDSPLAGHHTARPSLLQSERSQHERVYGYLSTRICVLLIKLPSVVNIQPPVVITY